MPVGRMAHAPTGPASVVCCERIFRVLREHEAISCMLANRPTPPVPAKNSILIARIEFAHVRL
jgi:hypothetical protein